MLADFVGVRRSTVSEWCNGKSVPHLDPGGMARLCIGLKCSSIIELHQLFSPDAPSLLELSQELEQIKSSAKKA